jgi:hypothetical protein
MKGQTSAVYVLIRMLKHKYFVNINNFFNKHLQSKRVVSPFN